MAESVFRKYSSLILKHGIDIASREIVIGGRITEATFLRFDRHMKLLENKEEPITVLICSGGGAVNAGTAIMDRIRMSPCEITTVGIGTIMSMGLFILASGDIRKATRFTEFMHHSSSIDLTMDKISTQENEIKATKKLENRLNRYLADVTKKPYSFWCATGKHQNYYFDSEEALELGVIDEIL